MALMANGRVAPPPAPASAPASVSLPLERERVRCLLLINTQLMKKVLKVYNNQAILNSLSPQQRQQVIELYQYCTKRLHCNLSVLSYIYEKYHEDGGASSTQSKTSFPFILSPPPDMPELAQLYQKLQELYPEAVQFLKMKLLQWKRAQQDLQQDQGGLLTAMGMNPLQQQVPLQQHSPPPSLTGRASQQQQQQQQQQIPPVANSPQISSQIPSSVQRQMGGQLSQLHTPVMANSPMANSMYKNNVSNTPGYMQHPPPPKQQSQTQQQQQQNLPMIQNANFNPNMNQSYKHMNQNINPNINQNMNQPGPARRSVSSAHNTPMSTMLPQQILQQANSMTPTNDAFGGNDDNLGMGMGFQNFNEGLDAMGAMRNNSGSGTSSGMFGDQGNSVSTMLLMNSNLMGDMNLMANGSMMD